MKCIAIDDEPVALKIIEQFCKRCSDLEVTSYTDPITGLEKVIGCAASGVYCPMQ